MEQKHRITPIFGQISEYGKESVRLYKADETRWEKLWDAFVNEYHYLGYDGCMGGRIKYFITLEDTVVGAISFCSAKRRLAPRDRYMGWNDEMREKMLPHIVNNNRFLILPWVKIRNMASRILSMSLNRLQADWEKQYGVTPYMVETFVDCEKYAGTCYKASNWMCLGFTKGYGKIGREFVYHGNKKRIYAIFLTKKLVEQFNPDITRVNEKEELLSMLNGTPMWYPALLKELGITNKPGQKITNRFADYLALYTPFLGRSDNKLHFTTMLQGLLSDLKRKSIEPIAIAYEGVDGVRNLTNFMSRGKWDDAGMFRKYRQVLSETLSHNEGMITGDESSFPKKGNGSVGVARQYCGNTGKVDNCQSGVMTGYASANGYGIIDYNLYFPEKWFSDDYAALRKKCKVPKNVIDDGFKTKNAILLDMVRNAAASGMFPAKYVGVDSAFGSDAEFLDGLPENVIYFADVRSNQLVFESRPVLLVPPYSGKGRKPTKEAPLFAARMVKDIVADSGAPWEKVVLGIGAKGPVIAEDKCIRVVESRNGLPCKDVWLYVRKFDNGTVKYSLCNEDMGASKKDIRKPALMRWSIEQCFKECKDYLGMDHYESRSWIAWNRHILLTLIVHLFIVKLRTEFSRNPKKPGVAPFITKPVSLGEYLDAHMKLILGAPIEHPDIHALPNSPQQFMTIGLVQKLVNSAFPKVGLIVEEVDYLLSKAASAFDSHTLSTVNKAIASMC